MNIISWNINFSERTVGEFESFDWNHRKERVLDFLCCHGRDSILLIQEATLESSEDIRQALPLHQIHVKQNHPSGRYLLSAFPIDWKVLSVTSIPLLEGARESWHSFHLADHDLLVTNVHLPMDRKFRLPLTVHIASQTEALAKALGANCVMAGDFNTFPDDMGYEQVMSAQTGIYREATSILLDSCNPKLRILETFCAFPYDIVPDAPNKYRYHLDHIFVSGDMKTSIPMCFVSDASDHYALLIILFKR